MPDGLPPKGRISYEEAKTLARDSDLRVRTDLAGRADLRPEILYFLAEDPAAEVRREIAANRSTPRQADLLLARDRDEEVRFVLAGKVARLLPNLDPDSQDRAQRCLIEALEALVQDQAVRVRQILAETLKDKANAPPEVIQRLARDVEDAVACPVLELSPLLSDGDLLEIIETAASGRLDAIARRRDIGETVADAIVARERSDSVTELLGNKSAQIREDTLDRLVEQAPSQPRWHQPLVERPRLSGAAIRKLAGFVTQSLLKVLEKRSDLDHQTAKEVAREVERRLVEEKPEKPEKAAGETVEARARRLFLQGKLDDELLSDALMGGDREFVRYALALRTGLALALVERVVADRSVKGVVACAWKAGCSAHLAVQLQVHLAGIEPARMLKPALGGGYSMTEEELNWQIEFLQSLAG
ncbi:MAG: DUF2336 domain-containing protein [Kiloniellales bacterium]